MQIVYEDQPSNDFKSLFMRLAGIRINSATPLPILKLIMKGKYLKSTHDFIYCNMIYNAQLQKYMAASNGFTVMSLNLGLYMAGSNGFTVMSLNLGLYMPQMRNSHSCSHRPYTSE